MADSLSPADAFAEAVRLAGGQAPTGRLVGVTQGAIWQRLKGRKPARPGWVLKLEERTGISRHDLAPDIYPRPAAPSAAAPDARFEHAS